MDRSTIKLDALRMDGAMQGGIRMERKRLAGAVILILGATAGAISMLTQLLGWLSGRH